MPVRLRGQIDLPQKLMEKRLVKRVRLPLVDSRQRRAGNRGDAQVIQLALLGRQITDDVARALTASKLRQGHRDELRPTRHLP